MKQQSQLEVVWSTKCKIFQKKKFFLKEIIACLGEIDDRNQLINNNCGHMQGF